MNNYLKEYQEYWIKAVNEGMRNINISWVKEVEQKDIDEMILKTNNFEELEKVLEEILGLIYAKTKKNFLSSNHINIWNSNRVLFEKYLKNEWDKESEEQKKVLGNIIIRLEKEKVRFKKFLDKIEELLQLENLNDLFEKKEYEIFKDCALIDIINWYHEHEKIIASRLDIFDKDASGYIIGINEDKVKVYIEARNEIQALKNELKGEQQLSESLRKVYATQKEAFKQVRENLQQAQAEVSQLTNLVDEYDILLETLEYKPTFDDKNPATAWQDLKTWLIGKTLSQLIEESNEYNRIHAKLNGAVSDSELDTFVNHTCPTCPHADYDNIKDERDIYKSKANEYDRIHTKLSGKVSDSELDALLNNSPNCSHSDYDTIKHERNALKTENAQLKTDGDTQVANKEKAILEKVITDCNLGLDKSSNLEQIITKIKELTKTPDSSVENNNKVEELKQKNKQLLTQLQKKEAIIKNYQKPVTKMPAPIMKTIKEETIRCGENWWNINSEVKQNLQQAETFEQMLSVENKFFKEKLGEEVNKTKTNTYLNIFLVLLSISIFGTSAYLLIKSKLSKLGRKVSE